MPTPSLRELQGLFWRAIADAPGTLAPPRDLLDVAEPCGALDAYARLSIYADAYFWRLHDVLAENFPRLAAVVGPEGFEELARGYLAAHPPDEPSVRHVGSHLAGRLAERGDVPPYLADLARLEWARLAVFDAPDCAALTADALRAVPAGAWPALRFGAVSALAVVHAGWPLHELWTGTEPASLRPAATMLRVWRAGDGRVFHAPMDAREADALARLMAGQTLAAMCAAFDDLPPHQAGREATALLARWLEDGIIARVG